MADTSSVCSMCGDIGFSDKLFRCTRCLFRFQHSYCSNYYDEEPSKTPGVCDWCLSEERSSSRHEVAHSKKPAAAGKDGGRSAKQDRDQDESGGNRGRAAGTSGTSSSPKPAGRRYKLLKDVSC